jgi:hypothetical protein
VQRYRHLVGILNKHLTLNNHYNVNNSTNLTIDLTKLKLKENHKLLTSDIKELYVNIPTDETLTITKSMLLNSHDTQIPQQIITVMKLILSYNDFTFQNKTYQPEKKEYPWVHQSEVQ